MGTTTTRLKIVYFVCVALVFAPLIGFVPGLPTMFESGSEAALGHFWVAWPCFPVSILLAWWSIPTIVAFAGGVGVLDEDTRAQIARERQRPMTEVRALTIEGLEGSLRAASIRRRYGHLAVGVFVSSLFLMLYAIETVNARFAGDYVAVQCQLVSSFTRPSGRWRATMRCALPDGSVREGTASVAGGPPPTFVARARRGALGVWLLDVESIAVFRVRAP